MYYTATYVGLNEVVKLNFTFEVPFQSCLHTSCFSYSLQLLTEMFPSKKQYNVSNTCHYHDYRCNTNQYSYIDYTCGRIFSLLYINTSYVSETITTHFFHMSLQ